MTKTPEEMLQAVKQDALHKLEREMLDIDDEYDFLPVMLARISESTGMDQQTIIRAAARTQTNHSNVSFAQLIAILNTFFLKQRQIENEDNQKTH